MPDIGRLLGKPIPDFAMTSTDGGKLTKKSLFGKVYVLDFWASWCGPCKIVSGHLNDFHKSYAKKGLHIIGANMGEDPKSKNVAALYKKEHKYAYTFTKENDKLAGKLGVVNLPTLILVDQKGTVDKIFVGWHPTEVGAKLEERIKALLNLDK